MTENDTKIILKAYKTLRALKFYRPGFVCEISEKGTYILVG